MDKTVEISLAKFLVDQDFPAFDAALKIEPEYSLKSLENSKVAIAHLKSESATLLFVSVNTTEDVFQLSLVVKEAKKKNLKTKFVVICGKGHQFDKYVAKLGIMDFIEINTTTKALRYKIDFWVKSLKAQFSKESIAENKLKVLSEGTRTSSVHKEEQTPVWIDSLELENDTWLISSKSNCRKVLTKWIVGLTGPSPFVGRWIDAGKGCWEFNFSSEGNLFCPNHGRWYFTGNQKPEFVWKENIWLLTGDEFELFHKTETEKLSRLILEKNVLTICNNSQYALSKRTIILKSFDQEVYFESVEEQKEKKIFGNTNKSFDNLKGKATNDFLDKFLLGDQTTNEINNSTLAGKSSTDDLSSDLLVATFEKNQVNKDNTTYIDQGSDRQGSNAHARLETAQQGSILEIELNKSPEKQLEIAVDSNKSGFLSAQMKTPLDKELSLTESKNKALNSEKSADQTPRPELTLEDSGQSEVTRPDIGKKIENPRRSGNEFSAKEESSERKNNFEPNIAQLPDAPIGHYDGALAAKSPKKENRVENKEENTAGPATKEQIKDDEINRKPLLLVDIPPHEKTNGKEAQKLSVDMGSNFTSQSPKRLKVLFDKAAKQYKTG